MSVKPIKYVPIATIVIAATGLLAIPLRADHIAPGDPVKGAEIYNQTCIACHGASGKGEIEGVPDFTKKKNPLSQPDDLLLDHMLNGFQSEGSFMEMPPGGGNPDLTEKDMADVLAYLREAFGRK